MLFSLGVQRETHAKGGDGLLTIVIKIQIYIYIYVYMCIYAEIKDRRI